MTEHKIPVLPSATFLPDPDFPLSVRRSTRHGAVGLHAHEFMELVIIRSGQGTHYSMDQEVPIRTGDIFSIPPNQAHGYRNTRNLDLINIMFQPEIFMDSEEAIARLPGYRVLFRPNPDRRSGDRFEVPLHLEGEAFVRVNSLVDSIVREITATPPGYQPLVGGLFTQLAVTISRLYSDAVHPPAIALLELERVLDYLRKHFDTDLRLEDLARKAGMSVSTLLRRFRLATGSTPVEFLLRLRLERAREILSTSERRITDIAFASGFRDSNYFSRQFKRHTGVSPRAYRQSLRYLSSG